MIPNLADYGVSRDAFSHFSFTFSDFSFGSFFYSAPKEFSSFYIAPQGNSNQPGLGIPSTYDDLYIINAGLLKVFLCLT